MLGLWELTTFAPGWESLRTIAAYSYIEGVNNPPKAYLAITE